MKKLAKSETEEEIKKIENLKLSPAEIKKIKSLAMSHQIKLGALRKKFCKKCYSFFDSKNSEIRIKKGKKIVKCKNCGYISRWKIK